MGTVVARIDAGVGGGVPRGRGVQERQRCSRKQRDEKVRDGVTESLERRPCSGRTVMSQGGGADELQIGEHSK